jgi:hypothetical protein
MRITPALRSNTPRQHCAHVIRTEDETHAAAEKPDDARSRNEDQGPRGRECHLAPPERAGPSFDQRRSQLMASFGSSSLGWPGYIPSGLDFHCETNQSSSLRGSAIACLGYPFVVGLRGTWPCPARPLFLVRARPP